MHLFSVLLPLKNENEIMEEKLFNKNYLCLCAANFLFFFSFYLLLPVLPFFIMEKFHEGNAMIGTVISCYTLATLVVRPFSGYMMDTFKRKPVSTKKSHSLIHFPLSASMPSAITFQT